MTKPLCPAFSFHRCLPESEVEEKKGDGTEIKLRFLIYGWGGLCWDGKVQGEVEYEAVYVDQWVGSEIVCQIGWGGGEKIVD